MSLSYYLKSVTDDEVKAIQKAHKYWSDEEEKLKEIEKPQPSPIKFSPTATQDMIRNTVESKYKTKPYDFTLDTSQKTPEQKKNIARDEMLKKNPALKLAEKYVAGVSGAANTATLGLFPTLLKAQESMGLGQKGTYQRIQDIQERNPYTTGVGEFAGYLAPGALATKALQATSIGQKLLPKAGESVGSFLGKGALTGAIEGAPMGAIEGAFESIRDDKPFLPTVGNSALQGAISGALFGGVGGVASKGIQNYNAFKTGLKSVGESIDNYNFPQLREPQLVPLPDSLAKSPKFSAEIPIQYRQPLPKLDEPLALPPPSQKFYLSKQSGTENAGKKFQPVRNVTETITEKYFPYKLKSINGKTFTLKPKDVVVTQPKVDGAETNVEAISDSKFKGWKNTIHTNKESYNVGDTYLDYPNGVRQIIEIDKGGKYDKYLVKDITDDLSTTAYADIVNKTSIDDIIKNRKNIIGKFNSSIEYDNKQKIKSFDNEKELYLGSWFEKLNKTQKTKANQYLNGKQKTYLINDKTKILTPKKFIENIYNDVIKSEIVETPNSAFNRKEYRLIMDDTSYYKVNKYEFDYYNGLKNDGFPELKKEMPKMQKFLEDTQLKANVSTTFKTPQKLSDFTPQNKLKMKTREVQVTRKVPVSTAELEAKWKEAAAKKSPFYVPSQFRKEIAGDPTRTIRNPRKVENVNENVIPESPNIPIKNESNIISPEENKNAIQGNLASNKVVQTNGSKSETVQNNNNNNEPPTPPPSTSFESEPPPPKNSSKVKEDEPIYATSKVVSNTVRNNIPEVQTPEGQRFVDELNGIYEVKTNEKTIQKAQELLKDDYEGLYNKVMEKGVDSAEENVAAIQVLRDLIANKDTKKAIGLIGKIREYGTNFGQIVQSFSVASKDSLAGKAIRAENMFRKIEKEILESKPFIPNVIKEITNAVGKNYKLLDINLQLFAESVDKDLKKIMGKFYKKDYINRIMKVVNEGGIPTKGTKGAIENGYASPVLSKEMKEKIALAVKEKYGIPTFDANDLDKMTKLYDELDGLPENSWEYRKTMYKINQVVQDKMPRSWQDKLASYQFVNLYGNTITPLKIGVGNIGSLGQVFTKDVLRYAIDKVIPGKKAYAMPDLKEYVKGIKKGAKESYLDYKNEVDTDPFAQSYDTFDEEKGLIFRNKFARESEKLVKLFLGIMERPAKQAIYNAELKMLMQGAKEPTTEMMDAAIEKANRVMFSHSNELTKGVSSLRGTVNKWTNKALNKIPGIKIDEKDQRKFGLGNLVQPIIKTPINMGITAIEYSPLGLLFNLKNRASFIDSLAKSIIGSVIGVAAYQGKKSGIISGGVPKDADARNYADEQGRQPYAINVGGKSVDVSYVQPLGMLMSFGAELASDKQNKEPLKAAMDSLLQQSMLQGFARLLGASYVQGKSSISDNVIEAITGGANTLVPAGSLQNQIGKSIDLYKRDTSDDSIWYKNIVNKSLQKTPARLALPPKVSNTGEMVKEDNLFNIWATPGRIKTISNDVVSNELFRLYDEAGETMQFPPKAKNIITYKISKKGKSQQKELSKQELTNFQMALGKSNMKALQDIMKTSEYKRANDKQKANMLSEAMANNKQEVETKQLRNVGIREYKPNKK